MKIFRNVVFAALWLLILVPLVLGAKAAHPATDDFTFALYTHPTWVETGSLPHVIKDALSYTLRTWRDWQGTMTGVVVMALGPTAFTLEYYGVHAVVLLGMSLAAWFVFLFHMLKKRIGLPAHAVLTVYFAMTAAALAYLPDMVEGIYWYNGAWFYMGAQALALVTLALCDRFVETALQGAKKVLFAALCCVLLFLLGMDNYITAMMTAASLMMMALWRLWAAKKTPAGAVTGVQMGKDWQEHHYGGEADAAHERLAGLRTAKLLIPIGIGLLISVLAPGNAVRMAADGAHESGIVYLGLSIVRTLTAAGGYFGRFLFRTPMALLLTAMTPMLCRALREVPVRRSYRMPAIPVILLGAYLILCAMIIPHMYASGNAGSGRVVNMYHCYVALASVLCWVLCLMRLAPETRTYLCGPVWKLRGAALIVLFALVCVWGGQHGSYVKLVRDQRDGTQDAYIAQIKNEYALCEAAGPEDDVILPAWTVQTMTGKITATEDPLLWTNEAMAQYFGVKSVKAE